MLSGRMSQDSLHAKVPKPLWAHRVVWGGAVQRESSGSEGRAEPMRT
jgi:hypothetical protein